MTSGHTGQGLLHMPGLGGAVVMVVICVQRQVLTARFPKEQADVDILTASILVYVVVENDILMFFY